MTRPLDVLIVENHHGAARQAEEELVAAGHRVHRCHDPESRGFPCVGVLDPDACPLERHVDVALLVRDHVTPRPQPLETGVSCAIRAGVPLVEEGSDVLDPYDRWVDERVLRGHDVVPACVRAADRAFDELRTRIRRRTAALLTAAAIAPGALEVRFEPDGDALRVVLLIDGEVDRALQQALAVRVLDAVRAERRTFGRVGVEVRGTEPSIASTPRAATA